METGTLQSIHKETGSGERVPKPLILALPVDSAWTFVGFDIHFIVIHINLGNVHFKVVGQELDGLPNGSYPGPARRLKYLLQWWQVCACSCRGRKRVRRAGRNPASRQTDRQTTQSQRSPSPHPKRGGLALTLLAVAAAELGPAQREVEGASPGTVRQAPAQAKPPKGSTKPPLCRRRTAHRQTNNLRLASGKGTHPGPRVAAAPTFGGQGTPTARPDHGRTRVLAYAAIPVTPFPDQMRGQKATFAFPDAEGQAVPNVQVRRALKAAGTPPPSCAATSVSHKKCRNMQTTRTAARNSSALALKSK